MCDYSLHLSLSRDAELGEELVVSRFLGTYTKGFASPLPKGEYPDCAVCLKPGTEIVFSENVYEEKFILFTGFIRKKKVGSCFATFRQIDLNNPCTHHDALEFDNGRVIKISNLVAGQKAFVIQLPASKSLSDKSSKVTVTTIELENVQ